MQLQPKTGRFVDSVLLGEQLHQLFVNGGRLRRLPHSNECPRQELQGVDCAGLGIEAELELDQRPLLVPGREIRLRQLSRHWEIVRIERTKALQYALQILQSVVSLEVLRRALELIRGFGWHVLARIQLAQLHPRGDVVRGQVHQLLEDIERAADIPRLLVLTSDQLVIGRRLRHQLELLMKLPQAQVDIHQGWIELEDLLVKRHRLQEETLFRITFGNLDKKLRCLCAVAFLLKQLAQLLKDANVSWIRL